MDYPKRKKWKQKGTSQIYEALNLRNQPRFETQKLQQNLHQFPHENTQQDSPRMPKFSLEPEIKALAMKYLKQSVDSNSTTKP